MSNEPAATGQRYRFRHHDVGLSYVDFGGAAAAAEAPLLLALHGRCGSARNFAPLARALQPDWHLLALDQRGHGASDHPPDGSRTAFVSDAVAWIRHVSPQRPVVLLGHSLGGINAYQLAAWHPELVRAVIVEDIGARPVPGLAPPPEPWPLRWDSLGALLAHLAASPFGMDRFFLDSIREFDDGWGFTFADSWYEEYCRPHLKDDRSADWAAVQCPILLIHGTKSWALRQSEADRMLALNSRAQYRRFAAGHVIHDECAAEFAAALREFLSALPR